MITHSNGNSATVKAARTALRQSKAVEGRKMASSLISGSHAMSDLLTIREKGILLSLLEHHCKLIKSTVAQILQAKDTLDENPSWHCLDCGVVCLIEDKSLQSYFLRLYCVKRVQLLWEQELYVPFKYTAARTYFHTFPAEVHQVGLNFANETEAEEFHLAVNAICEWMTTTFDMTQVEIASSSSKAPLYLRKEPAADLNEEKHLPGDSTLPAMGSDVDAAMRRMLMQARLSEEDLKDKDVAEAVDYIINQCGGLKALQRELKRRGPVSQTLPRAAGSSISQKKPLPPVPSNKKGTTSQQTPQGASTLHRSHHWMSSTSPAPPSETKRSTSFKHVSFSAGAEKS